MSNLTNLIDIVVDADGAPANGQVTLYWPMFMVGQSPITQGQKTFEIIDGALDLSLFPTTSAQPLGSYYTATFQLENGAVYDEYWTVPASAVPVKLNNVRAMFPPVPGLFINVAQLTGGGAKVGQFLGWNDNAWVPMNVTTLNVSPNTIGLTVTSNSGPDISVPVDNAMLGSGLSLNIPDAGPTSRGVVTMGTQAFGGTKTFQDQARFSSTIILSSFVPTGPQLGTVWFDSNAFHLQGSLQLQAGATLLANQAILNHVDLTGAGLSSAVTSPQITFPGQEAIRLPGSSVAHGIGVDANNWLWLGSGSAFASLRPDAAWVANWIDLSPYQHPTQVGAQLVPSQASMVLYQDANNWIGIGIDANLRMWFHVGPASYFLAPDGGSLGLITYVNSSLVAQRAGINLVAGPNVTMSATDNAVGNRVDVVITAAGNMVDPLTARGDLIVRGLSVPERLPAIFDNAYRVLVCDPMSVLGLSWTVGVPTTRRITAGAGLWGGGDLSGDVDIWASVLSVFGRTGNVVLTATDVTNAGGIADPTNLKGDLLVRSDLPTINRGLTRLGVGPNGSVLTADSTQTTGLKWGPANQMNLPTTAPAVGSKLLWADPADGYRVKWAV